MERDIKIIIIENGQKSEIHTYHGEYMSLMFLLKDKFFVEDFGECGGSGRCSTCLVKASGITGNALIKERNEPSTLAKSGYLEKDIRLSCQLLITKDLNNTEIEILS